MESNQEKLIKEKKLQDQQILVLNEKIVSLENNLLSFMKDKLESTDNEVKMMQNEPERVKDLERKVEECLDILVHSEIELRLFEVKNGLEKITNMKNQNQVNESPHKSNKMNEDTLACDDASNESKTVKHVTENQVRKEIEFCVDIQRKLRMRVSTIWRENFDQNRKMLENFKEDLNNNFKKMTVEVSLPVHKLKMYEEKINKFNSECYAILNKKITKNDKTSIFKRTMKSNYETLINEMIQIRNLK